jgi:hypothetical protein
MLSQNQFPEPNQHFDFSSFNFTVQDHVLSTAGDALRVTEPAPTIHWMDACYNPFS